MAVYNISIYGYGSEITIGSLEPDVAQYWKLHSGDLRDHLSGSHGPEWPDPLHPEEFQLQSWYEHDDICHRHGADYHNAHIEVRDLENSIIYAANITTEWQQQMQQLDRVDQFACAERLDVSIRDPGFYLRTQTHERGEFWRGMISSDDFFDPALLHIHYADVDGFAMITDVGYAGQPVVNLDGWDTSCYSVTHEIQLV